MYGFGWARRAVLKFLRVEAQESAGNIRAKVMKKRSGLSLAALVGVVAAVVGGVLAGRWLVRGAPQPA